MQGGAQMEGIVQVNSDSFEWDAKWYSASRKEKEYWTAELAIPFKSFRFPKNQTQWGINFIRNDMSNNCFSTWNRVPIQFFGANLNCLGKMSFADGMPEIKSNHSFIPYLSAKMDQANNSLSGPSLNAGLDAKIALGTSMNLDATVNPDFHGGRRQPDYQPGSIQCSSAGKRTFSRKQRPIYQYRFAGNRCSLSRKDWLASDGT
jgi:hypothetical protein